MTGLTGKVSFVHMGDTHLGYKGLQKIAGGRNIRSVDTQNSFEYMVSEVGGMAKRDEIDFVLHAGDVFDHSRPAWRDVAVFMQAMMELSSYGIPVVVIAGNHDTPRIRTGGSVFDVLQKIPGIHVVHGYEPRVIDLKVRETTVTVHAYPWGTTIAGTGAVKDATPSNKGIDILLSHGTLLGSAVRLPRMIDEDIPVEVANRFQYAALGHLHTVERADDTAWYSGSIERFGWGDYKARTGYRVVELGTGGSVKSTARDIPGRPMMNMRLTDATGMSVDDVVSDMCQRRDEMVLRQIDPATGEPYIPMLRWRIKGMSSSDFGIVKRLYKRAHPLSWADTLDYVVEGVAETEEERKKRVKMEAPSLDNMFRDFVKHRIEQGEMSETFAEKFMSKGMDALEVASEQRRESAPEE